MAALAVVEDLKILGSLYGSLRLYAYVPIPKASGHTTSLYTRRETRLEALRIDFA